MSKLGGLVIALIVTTLLGPASLVMPPAMAVENGRIVGGVDDSDTTVAPTGQTQAQLQVLNGSTWSTVANYYTDQDGDYATDPLPAGTYRVEFSNPGYITRLSEPVTVTDGSTQYIDITLIRGATIQGRVNVPSDGPGASGWIRIYEQQGRTWSQLLETPVQPDGTFSVDDLLYGAYKVAFGDATGHYATEYFDNVATLQEAQVVILKSGSVTTIDATLSPIATNVMATGLRIIGTPRVGQKVRAKVGTITPPTASVGYAWFLGARRIKDATRRSLRLRATMLDRRVSVRVTATSAGLTAWREFSNAKRVRPPR